METHDPKKLRQLYPHIPELVLQTLERWDSGTIAGEPGQFLQAVLKNDLQGAFSRADHYSTLAMKDIVLFCFNELFGEAWGSPEKYAAWLRRIIRFREVAFLCMWCDHPQDVHENQPRNLVHKCTQCKCSGFQARSIHDV